MHVERQVGIGVGEDVTIAERAEALRSAVGYYGSIIFGPSRPDGTPRKLMSTARLNAMGWRARVSLAEGLAAAYKDFQRSCS